MTLELWTFLYDEGVMMHWRQLTLTETGIDFSSCKLCIGPTFWQYMIRDRWSFVIWQLFLFLHLSSKFKIHRHICIRGYSVMHCCTSILMFVSDNSVVKLRSTCLIYGFTLQVQSFFLLCTYKVSCGTWICYYVGWSLDVLIVSATSSVAVIFLIIKHRAWGTKDPAFFVPFHQ